MNSIAWTYPGFQSLPKGIQQMLVASESHFSNAARRGSAHAVAEPVSRGESRTPRLIRAIDGQFTGTGYAWGKQNQFIPTLTV
jgi:hypothetical protein